MILYLTAIFSKFYSYSHFTAEDLWKKHKQDSEPSAKPPIAGQLLKCYKACLIFFNESMLTHIYFISMIRDAAPSTTNFYQTIKLFLYFKRTYIQVNILSVFFSPLILRFIYNICSK